MSPVLHTQLLGEFCVLVDGQPCHGLNKPRQQALLAWLLLHRHAPQSRQQLAFSFWPDSSEEQAHTNLRKLLFQLRQALPDADRFLFTDAQHMGWRADAPSTLDVAELEQNLTLLEKGAAATVATMQRVVELYAGELLPGCYEEWLLPIRRALHERVMRVLEQALVQLEMQHEYQPGLHAAEHLLRLDPLHEPAYRHLMRFRALTGDRAGALKVYHDCVGVLAEELGVPPATETQALYQQLLKSETPPGAAPGVAAAPSPTHVPLVGRSAEWQTLRQTWRETLHHGPHMAVVWGEAGVGKTRLVEELVHGARLRPGSVAYARAYAAEGALAYAPLTEWLRSEALRPGLARLDALWRSELARLLPELLTEQPALPPPAPMGEAWQQQRFYEALARAVYTAPAPCLLVLDDLQWCDDETMAWLRYLLRFDPAAQLLVVGAARGEALDAQHPLHGLRAQLQRAGQWRELTLAPLSVQETAVLAGHLVQEDASAWAGALYRETEGNPLFVVEMVRAGFAAMQAGSTVVLPQTVQAVIEERLSHLSPQARQLTQVAATLGRAFTLEELAGASGFTEDMLVVGLDELWQRRIVRAQGEGYDFGHDKIREVAYRQTSGPRRRLLHLRTGVALARLYAGREDEVVGELAVHAQQAGQLQQAIGYLARAAQVAQAVGAYAEVAAYLRKALGLLPSLSLPRTAAARQELALLVPLGACLLASRGYGDAEVQNIYRRAYTICAHLPDDAHLMPVLVGLALFFLVHGEIKQSQVIAEQAMALARQTNDDGLLLEAHHITGPVLQYLGQFEDSVHHLEQGARSYDQSRHSVHAEIYGQDPGVMCRVLLATALWHTGQLDQSLAVMQEGMTLARSLTHSYSLNFAEAFVAHLHHLHQEPDAVLPAACEAMKSAEHFGFPYLIAITTMFRGWATLRLNLQGRFDPTQDALTQDECIQLIQVGYERFKLTGARLFRGYYLGILGEALLSCGKYADALAAIEEGLAIVRSSDDQFWRAELHRLRGEISLALGQEGVSGADRTEEAEQAFVQALQTAQVQGSKMCELRASTSLTRLWQRQGQCAKAHALLKPICDWFTEGHDTPDLQAAHALLAELE